MMHVGNIKQVSLSLSLIFLPNGAHYSTSKRNECHFIKSCPIEIQLRCVLSIAVCVIFLREGTNSVHIRFSIQYRHPKKHDIASFSHTSDRSKGDTERSVFSFLHHDNRGFYFHILIPFSRRNDHDTSEKLRSKKTKNKIHAQQFFYWSFNRTKSSLHFPSQICE